MTDTRSIEARRIIEGIRHYRRGLRQLENGEREQAKTSAAAIAEIVMDDLRRDLLAAMSALAVSATSAEFDRRAAKRLEKRDMKMERATRLLDEIMEGGRKEEARRVERLARAVPWHRRSGILQKAEARLAEFVGMVKAAQLSYGEAEYQEAVADIRARYAGVEATT